MALTKMLITDLDGTLLRPDKTLTDYTVRVFERCRERGMLTGIATARYEIACASIVDRLRPDIVISADGALGKLRGQTVYGCSMSGETATNLIAALRAAGIDDIVVGHEQGCLWNSREIYKSSMLYEAVYDDFSEPLDTNMYKLLCKVRCQCAHQDIVESVVTRFPELKLISYPGESMHAFVRRDVSKENAVAAVAKYCGLEPESVVTFGDEVFDMGMLAYAGIGVAPDNARSEVQAIADAVCDSNEQDGVARWIETNLLIETAVY